VVLYLAATRRLFVRRTWQRLHLVTGMLVFLAIAAPWHVLATLRNPPYFEFSLSSGPVGYHGFLWFYLVNEHLLRFLNLRYPRDYSTVPRLWFWLLHLVWFFPWSVYVPRLARLSYQPKDRPGRTALFALCWIAFVMVFFSFSTTQEYYSMPIYPAIALLLGRAMAADPAGLGKPAKFAAGIAGVCACTAIIILVAVRHVPVLGDISSALTQNPDLYTLSLGHMADLTLHAFAWLRLPLALAAAAFLVGAIGVWRLRRQQVVVFALAAMMVVLFQAARLALIVFDPYLSSRPLAEALNRAPRGKLIVDGQYYAFSSIFFYTDYSALLLNGRVNNLEYGSNAPGVPAVFLTDRDIGPLWQGNGIWYLVANQQAVPRLGRLVAPAKIYVVAASGGKLLVSNRAQVASQAQ
jgi:hypothetical protein